MRTRLALGGLVGLVFLSCPVFTPAGIEGLERVASGLAAPIFVTHAPGDTSRLFIAQRGGQIRILDLATGTLQAAPFLSTTVDTSGEGGLLGLAFHPDYSSEGMPGFGKFYVNVTTGSPFTTRIREFSVSATNPNMANAGSLREILSYSQPQTNHNGGWLGFSPNDNFLYIASGDGGGGNDTGSGHTAGTGNAQDTTNNLLGKMLRIDVNSDAFPTDSSRNYAIPPTNPFVAGVGVPGDDVGDDEIWSFGLRNPFRASFDRVTGDLWIGDVGQGQREEIDFQPADSDGGENYGWRLREGLIQTPSVGGAKPPGNVDPAYDYNRDNDQFGGTVVTGGYVYRGPDEDLQGQYFFLDSRSTAGSGDDNYWMFDPADPFGTVENIDSLLTPDAGAPQFPVSFGEDAMGNLYIAYLASGEVYRIQTTASVAAATWNVDNGGIWSQGSNWTGDAAPNGVDQAATFGPVITANRTVAVDTAKTIGTITFNNAAASYNITGTNAITLSVTSGDAQINVTNGSHTISAPLTLASDTLITVTPAASNLSVTGALSANGLNLTKAGAGTLTLANVRAAGLLIDAGAVAVAPGGTAASTSLVGSLTIAGGATPTAKLDLNDNAAIINYTGASPVGTVRQQLLAGRGGSGVGKTWSGPGITSSAAMAANAAAPESRSVAYAENSTLPLGPYTMFRGQPVDDSSILMVYTRTGDANLDGVVNDNDVTIVGASYAPGVAQPQWALGDFDYNGFVDDDDVTLLGAFYDPSAMPAAISPTETAEAVAAVPEPSALALAAMAGLLAAATRSAGSRRRGRMFRSGCA
jgi:glucose/arabinose dehydrogenase